MSKKLNYLPLLGVLLCSHAIAQTLALTPAQQSSKACLLKDYNTSCIVAEETASSVFPQGVELAIREKHNEACGGDPNTSPVVRRVSIDRFGRIFDYQIVSDSLRLLNQADDKTKTLTDIDQWQHPTKEVFTKHGIRVNRVKLLAEQSFPYFYVQANSLLSQPQSSQRQKLLQQLLKANAQWDFMIVTDDGFSHYVEGKKRKLNKLYCLP